jgi:hypothetical protein
MRALCTSIGTRILFACWLMTALSVGCLSAAKYTMVCGSSAATCTTGDNLKISLTLDTAAAAEAAWADGKTHVTLAEQNDPKRALPEGLMRLQETGTPGVRQFNLQSVLDPDNVRSEQFLSVLYRKPAPSLQLQVLIQRPDQADTSLPFTLDLSSAYKDGTLDLLLGQNEGPKCVTVDNKASDCRMGAVLLLPFENLAQWEAATAHPSSRHILYLNDVAMTGLTPVPGGVGALSSAPYSLRYLLNRDLANADNAHAWQSLLATADRSPLVTTIGVGVDSRRWIYPPAQTVSIVLPRYSLLPWVIGALVLGLIWILATATPTLRAYPAVPLSKAAFDASPQKAGLAQLGIIGATFNPPYSLSMLFMALWSMVVSLSFFAFWGLTQSGDLINTTALALMGIGATSLVFSRAIDIPSDSDKVADQTLAAAITAYVPAPPNLATNVINATRAALEARLMTTGHWMPDLFSEKGSSRLDLHRLQVAAFTAFYFVVFLWSLNKTLALPNFSPNTLALLGISNAGYLGFKLAAQ